MGHGKTNGDDKGDKTRADCGLWDEGENKDGGSANLTVYLSL
jgi:hypothetical protein